MNRKQIDIQFSKALEKHLEKYDVIKYKEKLSGEKYIRYCKNIEEGEITWTIFLLRSGRVSVIVDLNFNKYIEFIKNEINSEVSDLNTFTIDINKYLTPENFDDYHHVPKKYDTPCSEWIEKGYHIDDAARIIVSEMFEKPINAIIEKLGSIDKAQKLLNNYDTVNAESGHINWLLYNANTIQQIISSLVLGVLVGNKNISQIANFYKKYMEKFPFEGRRDVSVAYELINYINKEK